MKSTYWYKSFVTSIIQEAPNTRRFFLKIDDKSTFTFLPGQFITFDLPIHDKLPLRLRSYSIASAPNKKNEIELVIVYNPAGSGGTEYLFNQVKTGSILIFKGPLGKFLLPKNIDRDICFICTGTGIAPFRSMIHHIFYTQKESLKHTINLIYGSRTEKDILYYNEMFELSEKHEILNYLITLSRAEKNNWIGYKGYVHEVYKELYKDLKPAYFYICGWKNMIMEARDNLKSMGYNKEFIKFELYG